MSYDGKYRIYYIINQKHMIELHIAEFEKERPRGKLLEYCKENNIDPEEIVKSEGQYSIENISEDRCTEIINNLINL